MTTHKIPLLHRVPASRRAAALLTVAAILASAACTALVDREAAQCRSDSDCASFGGHPYCQAGVCVASGLVPANCFYGTPSQPSDFLNQCTQAQCLSFDNCQRLGICGGASQMDAALVSPPVPEASTPASASSATSDGGTALPS